MKKLLLTLFFCLTIVNFAHSEGDIMPITRFYDFGGGLNTRDKNTNIKDNEASDLQNINLSGEVGSIKRRSGYDAIIDIAFVSADTANFKLQSGFDYRKNDGTQYLLVASSTTLKKLNVTSTDWDTICSTFTATTSNQFTDFVVYTDTSSTCILTNGKDNIMKYDGTNLLTLGTGTDPDDWRPNLAYYVEVFKGRLFFGNLVEGNGGVQDATTPYRVRWASDVGSRNIEGADAFPANSYLDIDDTKVTGMAVYADALCVFGERSISTIKGDMTTNNTFYLNKMVNGVGTLSNKTIVSIPEYGLLFQGHDGHIYRFTGGGYVTRVSDKILATINALNKSQLEIACAAFYPKYNQYWLCVPDRTSVYNNLVLVYDIIHDTWTKYGGIIGSCILQRDVSQTIKLYTGSSYTGLMYEQDKGVSDNGTAITAYYYSKSFSLDLIEYEKIFDAIYLQYYQVGAYNLRVNAVLDFGKAQVDHLVDLSPEGAVWNAFLWNVGLWGGNTVDWAELPIEQPGHFMQVKMTLSSDASNDWIVYGFTIRYRPEPLR